MPGSAQNVQQICAQARELRVHVFSDPDPDPDPKKAEFLDPDPVGSRPGFFVSNI